MEKRKPRVLIKPRVIRPKPPAEQDPFGKAKLLPERDSRAVSLLREEIRRIAREGAVPKALEPKEQLQKSPKPAHGKNPGSFIRKASRYLLDVLAISSIMMIGAAGLMIGRELYLNGRFSGAGSPPPATTAEAAREADGGVPQIVRLDNPENLFLYLTRHNAPAPRSATLTAFSSEDLALMRRYLGDSYVELLMQRNPPAMFSTSAEEVRATCAWNDAAGCYFLGTNAFIVATNLGQQGRIHELMHYVHFLNTQHEITFTDRGADGQRRIHIPTRLEEGMTELVAVNVMRGRVSGVGYPIETRIAAMIELVVGSEMLRGAYFSGDWATVQNSLNRRLGDWTFERLLNLLYSQDTGNIRAGDYADPYTCLPITYLSEKINSVSELRRELSRISNTDPILSATRTLCR